LEIFESDVVDVGVDVVVLAGGWEGEEEGEDWSVSVGTDRFVVVWGELGVFGPVVSLVCMLCISPGLLGRNQKKKNKRKEKKIK
jgi:hypothetical protein